MTLSFTTDASALAKAAARAASIAERRATVPILSNVKIDVIEGIVRLTSTDLDMTLVETLPGNGERDGTATVSAHTVHKVATALPSTSMVEIGCKDEFLTVVSGNYSASLVTLPSSDFPTMSEAAMPISFEMPAQTFASLFERVRHAISTEETRYYLNGVYLHSIGPVLYGVATDGHRLARTQIEWAGPEISGVIVPRLFVGKLCTALKRFKGDVAVECSRTHIRVTMGSLVFTAKAIDGTFPEYDRIIPRANPNTLTVARDDFGAAVKRVGAVLHNWHERTIRLDLAVGKSMVSGASSYNGTTRETLNGVTAYTGAPTTIGFQSRYVLDLLARCGERVEFQFKGGGDPVTAMTVGDLTTLHVLMPMRI
jgi:DNA polymerase III subunit beta